MATYQWLTADRGKVKTCSCMMEWYPLFDKMRIKRGIGKPQVSQGGYNNGAVKKSATTHDGGGVLDLGNYSAGIIKLAREMGAAAWHRTPEQSFRHHTHLILLKCPHLDGYPPRDPSEPTGAYAQQVSYYAGGSGLGGVPNDTEPRPNPQRDWKQGVAWAKQQLGDTTATPDPDNPGTHPEVPPDAGEVEHAEGASIVWIQRGNSGLVGYDSKGFSTLFLPSANGRWVSTKVGKTTTTPNPDPGTDPGTDPGDPGTGTPSGALKVTPAMISAANRGGGYSDANGKFTTTQIADAYNHAIAVSKGAVNSKKRLACVLGQCAQETGGYYYMVELGGPNTRYAPYYGRGFIQLTWGDNYKAFGVWMKGLGQITDADYFYKNPEEVAKVKWAAFTPIWYFATRSWNGKNLFQWCDGESSPWSKISRAINRGSPTSQAAAYHEGTRAKCTDAVLRML